VDKFPSGLLIILDDLTEIASSTDENYVMACSKKHYILGDKKALY
jgi:hypothetical protein